MINGVDIFFAVQFRYGSTPSAYAHYDFPGGDVHNSRGRIDGVIVAGGPGSTSVAARFDTSSLGAFFPRGRAVTVGGWSEAESSTSSGTTLYHHFAYDPVAAVQWTIPAN